MEIFMERSTVSGPGPGTRICNSANCRNRCFETLCWVKSTQAFVAGENFGVGFFEMGRGLRLAVGCLPWLLAELQCMVRDFGSKRYVIASY